MLLLTKIARRFVLIIIFVLYGLSIWEAWELDGKNNDSVTFYVSIIINSAMFFIFSFSLIFSKKIKELFSKTFFNDPKFKRDVCLRMKSFRPTSINFLFICVLILLLVPLVAITVLYFRETEEWNRRAISQFWFSYFILVFVWLSLHESCSIKEDIEEESKIKKIS